MRSLQAFFALLALAVAATGVARAEPLLIRNSYVVPVSNWAPLLVVKSGAKLPYEIPFAEAYLEKLDLQRKQVRMKLPEGLLEVNEPKRD